MSRFFAELRKLERLRDALDPAPDDLSGLELKEIAPGVFAGAPRRARRAGRTSRIILQMGEVRQLHARVKSGFEVARALIEKDRRR
jgi:hypothetical protein